ncbi:unnamed protein product [Peronospora belbahrii]|uniref:C2 NT-type domain-containing protein n=1 Tax=Peronospora belbahrii TaxID=622444 RepID=A0ABN8CNU7_9STRA|nr:unnamed protein product [Peronospora belbahrii]
MGPRSIYKATILVNLDVFIHRANIGHDISPNDHELIVLFRRQKKAGQSGAITSSFLKKEYEIVLVALPSHSAVALFSVDFATLVQLQASPQDRHKLFRILPLKCRDLAATLELDITWDLVQEPGNLHVNAAVDSETNLQAGSAGLAKLPPPSILLNKNSHALKAQTSTPQTPRSRETNKSRRSANESTLVSTRRTTAGLSSNGSERDLLEELSVSNCSNCRSAKRRLDRKEVQVLQLESFLKESQKRIDAQTTENEELMIREKAETRNAAHQRSLTLRLLQELETAVHLCKNEMQVHDTTLLPQVELIERVKKFHEEMDSLLHCHSEHSERLKSSHLSQTPQRSKTTFDFRAETEAALRRNQRLQEQLEFLGRSMEYDSDAGEDSTRTYRAATDTSGTTISSVRSGSVTVDCEERPVAFTMTQQLNNLERENFKLRTELEGVLVNASSALKKHLGGFSLRMTKGLSLTAEVSETSSSSSHEDIEEPENENAALLSQIREQHKFEAESSAALESELEQAKNDSKKVKDQIEVAQNESASKPDREQPLQAPGFLDKIYANVGKAKLVLEDRVKQLDELLANATEENDRLCNEIKDFQQQESDRHNEAIAVKPDARITELEELLKMREKELETNEEELVKTKRQLEDAVNRARAGDSVKLELETELAAVRLSLKVAQEATTQFEHRMAVLSSSAALASTTSHYSPSSDATVHGELADVQKQLKLSKQEVMQLRFRSNQLESVNERLEETLKEKRTLEVKLIALEGQLFEQRNRTITTDNNSFSQDVKNITMLTEMQRELDTKSAQLTIAEREIEHLRLQCSEQRGMNFISGNTEDVIDKVKRFENEIGRLCERNDEQARRLEKLARRVTVAVRERDGLEMIVEQMVTEMALLNKEVKVSTGARNGRTPSILEDEEMEGKKVMLDKDLSPQTVGQSGTTIIDRYANAVASTSLSHIPSSPNPDVSSSKVAMLVKNFSIHDEYSNGVKFYKGLRKSQLESRHRNISSTSS